MARSLATLGVLGLGAASASLSPVWPPPSSLAQFGGPAAFASNFDFEIVTAGAANEIGAVETARLSAAAQRGIETLQQRAASATFAADGLPEVSTVKFHVTGSSQQDGAVDIDTDYSYKLAVDGSTGEVNIFASSGMWLMRIVLSAIIAVLHLVPATYVVTQRVLICGTWWCIQICSLWRYVRHGVVGAAC